MPAGWPDAGPGVRAVAHLTHNPDDPVADQRPGAAYPTNYELSEDEAAEAWRGTRS
ncbi:hypothetical protein [Streptomyces enissocaesilis]